MMAMAVVRVRRLVTTTIALNLAWASTIAAAALDERSVSDYWESS